MENPCFFLQSSWSGPAHWPTSDRGKPKMSSRPRPFMAAWRDLIQSRIQIHQTEGNLYLSSRPRPFTAAWRDLIQPRIQIHQTEGNLYLSSRPRPFMAAWRDLIQPRIQIHQAEGNLYMSSRPRPFTAAWRDLKPYLLRSAHSGFILLISISFLLLLHLLSCFSLAIAFLIS